ncbi:hypothetical protein TWF191_004903 [Orbilia oligospora]|uniref:Uncharacterized protein n=3 Tax=Orbilia oligospora TaxID=2813651 RepID=A0A7C8V0R7_ORBOL|nr:hypothetical protein TWF191_004903 [Orbilia oligospora]
MESGKRSGSVNMTLVGLALKAQRDGQPFSSAAMETLQKHFSDIPPDVLVERVEVLQKARDELVVNKYGGVITMRPVHAGSSKVHSLPKSIKETVDAKISSDMGNAVRWSPSRPSPQRRSKRAPIHIPDLDTLVIADSEGDEAIVIPNPRRTTTRPFIRSLKQKGPPLELIPDPQSRVAHKTENIKLLSPTRAATISPTPRRVPPVRLPANATPVTSASGMGPIEEPNPKNELDHKPTLQLSENITLNPSECSPIKKVLNNKASRLRTQSNLEKIFGFESPKHGRLNFKKQSPSKSSSPSRSRPNLAKDIEAAASFAAIDSFFQNSPRRLKNNKHEDENKKQSSGDTQKAPVVKTTKPPLKRYFTNDSGDLGTSPSSLMFQMDEDMHFQQFPLQYMESDVGGNVNIDGNIEINVQSEATAGSITPQILSDITEPYQNQSPIYSKPPTAKSSSTISTISTIRKISLQGVKNEELLDTETELIKSEDLSEPTILNVKVGSRGLIINILCAGDLVMGETSIH